MNESLSPLLLDHVRQHKRPLSSIVYVRIILEPTVVVHLMGIGTDMFRQVQDLLLCCFTMFQTSPRW